MKFIRAARPGGPEVLEYTTTETPVPAANQVLIKVQAIGVNYADITLRQGTYPDMTPPFPLVPGMEASGVIESLGDSLTGLKKGQRVIALGEGAYAEYMLAPADSVFAVPDSVDLDLAAALPINYITAYHLLHTVGKLQPKQFVLATAAAGGVGTAIAHLSRLSGTQAIGIVSSEAKAAFAREQGYAHVLIQGPAQESEREREALISRVRQLTPNQGVNLMLDSVGGPLFLKNLEMLVPLGELVVYGIAAGIPRLNWSEPEFFNAFVKGQAIRPFSLASVQLGNPKAFTDSISTLFTWLREKNSCPSCLKFWLLKKRARHMSYSLSAKYWEKSYSNPESDER
jgi:NADPH2:quinone reductase